MKERWNLLLQKIQILRQSFSLSVYTPAILGVVLIVGVAATVTLSLQRQITRSGASSTEWSIQVDPKADVNLAQQTITAHIELVPPEGVANPPAVAAVGFHILYHVSSSEIQPWRTLQNTSGEENAVQEFTALHVHSPLSLFSLSLAINPQAGAFPLEGTNPSPIPPFAQGENPSITPALTPTIGTCTKSALGRFCSPKSTCSPLNGLQAVNAFSCSTPGDICCQKIVTTPTGNPQPTFHPTPTYTPICEEPQWYVQHGYCPKNSAGMNVCPPTAPDATSWCADAYHIPGITIQSVKGVAVGPGENTPQSISQANQVASPNHPETTSNMLYFSVGDQYGKVVTKQVLLANVVFTVNANTSEGKSLLASLSSANSTTLASLQKQLEAYLHTALIVQIGPDSKVFTLGTDPKNPFVKSNYVAVPATFTLAELLGITVSSTPSPMPTPIHCGGNVSNAPTCPTGYICKLGSIPDAGGICVPALATPTPAIRCGGNVNPPITCPTGYTCKITSVEAGGICIPLSPTPTLSCTPRPACLDANPACQIALPNMCPPTKAPTPTVNPKINGLSTSLFFACAEPQISGGLTMQDVNARYNSTACKQFPNRQNADVDGNGVINLTDWNMWYRSSLSH